MNYQNLYDVIVIGGGPAGLSAAIYMARAKYNVLVLEKSSIGGQITITSEVENYPGVGKVSGKELTETMRQQAERFGASFLLAEVTGMDLGEEIKTIHTTRGDYQALGVILAPGANPRKVGFQGEEEFQGRGVAYCATCDGEFFTGKEVLVIGGGFAAVEESIFLTRYASKITILVRGKEFSCAARVSDELKRYDKIQVLFETELLEAGGDGMLQSAILRDRKTGKTWEYRAESGGNFGIFVFAGYVPNTSWIGNGIALDEQGYLLTDSSQKTNLDGVYAAGDVCVKNLRQVVTAVSDGAVAATSLERVVSDLHEKLKIPDLSAVPQQDETVTGMHTEKMVESETQGFLDDTIRSQLSDVFAKFASTVFVRAWLDNSALSDEIKGFLTELTALTDRVVWEPAASQTESGIVKPAMELLFASGVSSGIFFHGVPGGHEFNSFIVALYHVAGTGQFLDPAVEERCRQLQKKIHLKILVSLSCTMCPETVMSCQKIAALNPNVTAEMFDLAHFPTLKEQYQVMSVPCVIVNDHKIVFGKKNVSEILDLLESNAIESQ